MFLPIPSFGIIGELSATTEDNLRAKIDWLPLSLKTERDCTSFLLCVLCLPRRRGQRDSRGSISHVIDSEPHLPASEVSEDLSQIVEALATIQPGAGPL